MIISIHLQRLIPLYAAMPFHLGPLISSPFQCIPVSFTYLYRPPVYSVYMCTENTCLQCPPVYREHHLATVSTCVQRTPPVYSVHLCTDNTTCLQFLPVYRKHLSSVSTCIQIMTVFNVYLCTDNICLQCLHVYRKHMSIVSTCIQKTSIQSVHLHTEKPLYREHMSIMSASDIDLNILTYWMAHPF